MGDAIPYREILEHVSSGILTLAKDGRIIAFNPAAAQILGLPREEVLERTFDEVFLSSTQDNSDFTQLILDAIYEPDKTHQQQVPFQRPDGNTVSLAVRTSCLMQEGTGQPPQPTIVITFADITEIDNLRNNERELNKKLQSAYLELEESNRSLLTALRKAQFIRWAATGLIFFFFVGLGAYIWRKTESKLPGSNTSAAVDENGATTITLKKQTALRRLFLSGQIEPLEKITISAPFAGNIVSRNFTYGQPVKKGDLLVALETRDLENKLREQQSTFIKAQLRYNELSGWENGPEVSRARRARAQADNDLSAAEKKLATSEFLFRKGIIAASELDDAREQVSRAAMGVRTAREEYEAVLSRGSSNNLEIARMELENARSGMEHVQMKIGEGRIVAPVTGVALRPETKNARNVKPMELGQSVDEGQPLLSIGNMQGITVHSEVDEVDVLKVKAGQDVEITGDAFPDITLRGTIESVSSHAKAGPGREPAFDITVRIPKMTEEQRNWIRMGMSATLGVVTYSNPEAFLVPIRAVHMVEGTPCITIMDTESEVRIVPVETGITTLDSVEIVGDFSEGDQVRVP